MKKINCGGFYIDEESLELEDNVLSVLNGGSSLLPIVTADDNGKVLTVVDGAWNKAEASGGDIVVVTIGFDSTTEEYTADKTYAEIAEAFSSGKKVLGTHINPSLMQFTSVGVFYQDTYEGVLEYDMKTIGYCNIDDKDYICKCSVFYSPNALIVQVTQTEVEI